MYYTTKERIYQELFDCQFSNSLIYRLNSDLSDVNTALSKIHRETVTISGTTTVEANSSKVVEIPKSSYSKQIYYRLIGSSSGIGIKLYNYGTSTTILWINP